MSVVLGSEIRLGFAQRCPTGFQRGLHEVPVETVRDPHEDLKHVLIWSQPVTQKQFLELKQLVDVGINVLI
jgi:hypothetical protein